MNPLSTYGLDLSSVLSKLAKSNMRFGYERQFSQIQNTTVKRINSEIERVVESDDTPRRLAALEKEYTKLESNKQLIDSFHQDLVSNTNRLERLQTTVGEALSAFTSDDDDTNLTADEVTTLTAKRDALIEDVEGLLITIHPDISTPGVIRDIKNMLDTLKAIEPVEGTVDAEDSGSPSNDNRNIYDDLSMLSGLLDTAYDVTVTTKENAADISLNISASLAEKTSDMTLLSSVELQKRQEQIDAIKAKYGNILRAFSLSFEARMDSLEQLTNSLEGQSVAPGSVLNLFT